MSIINVCGLNSLVGLVMQNDLPFYIVYKNVILFCECLLPTVSSHHLERHLLSHRFLSFLWIPIWRILLSLLKNWTCYCFRFSFLLRTISLSLFQHQFYIKRAKMIWWSVKKTLFFSPVPWSFTQLLYKQLFDSTQKREIFFLSLYFLDLFAGFNSDPVALFQALHTLYPRAVSRRRAAAGQKICRPRGE